LRFSKQSQFLRNTLYGHPFFFTKFILVEVGRHPKVIFQLDVVHKLPTKLPQKSWMKSSLPLLSRPVHCHS
jgi:hypothetical protein